MDREEKTQKMIQTYIAKWDQAVQELFITEFYHKYLLLFLYRFRQFLAVVRAPSSSLLSHDVFLVLVAVTRVARSDLMDHGTDASQQQFSEYFTAFAVLSAGLEPLDTAAAACAEALEQAGC